MGDNGKMFSMAEVTENNGKNGKPIWLIIKDNVYDVTGYLDDVSLINSFRILIILHIVVCTQHNTFLCKAGRLFLFQLFCHCVSPELLFSLICIIFAHLFHLLIVQYQ